MKLALMYHGVGERPARFGEPRYTVETSTFASQLDVLAGRATGLDGFLDGAAPGSVLLTFDDGEKSVIETALPLMRPRGLTGAAFITTGWIGTPGYLAPGDLEGLANAGWAVGTHGVSHRFLTELSDQELAEELGASREAVRRILGAAPEHMALPGGRSDARVIAAAARAGYRSIFTSRVGLNPDHPDPLAVRRQPVVRAMPAEELARLIRGDRLLHLTLRLRQQILDAGKRVLGDSLYVEVRAQLTRLAHRGEPTPQA